MALSVEQYNAKEEKALQKMGVAQITAFGTKTFEDHKKAVRVYRKVQAARALP